MNDVNFQNFPGIQKQRIHHKKIFGIDYSGSLQASKKIWICEAEFFKNEININSVYSIFDKFKIKSREETNYQIISLIKNNPDGVFGFDFPFSLPIRAIQNLSWKEFIINFDKTYKSENEFRNKLRKLFNFKDIKRKCDITSKTPFSPYNLRIYRQTYYGITEILKPLLLLNSTSVLPFDKTESKKSIIMEVCPASLMKIRKETIKWPGSYKGKKEVHRENRMKILDILLSHLNLKFLDLKNQEFILNDAEGDALDSLICVICALRGLSYPELSVKDENYMLEGYVYY